MNFESDYEDLLKYARWCIKSLKLNCEDVDLVNEAFILVQSSSEYSKDSVKKLIYRLARKELDSKTLWLSDVNKDNWRGNDSFCRCCRESLPINSFSYSVLPNGRYKVSSLCKLCHAKKTREKYIKRPKRQKKFNQKEWFAKNREKWNEYMRSRRPKKYPEGKPKQDIRVLWRKANRKRYEKIKAAKAVLNHLCK